jgi:hypothetical protein
MTSPARRLPLFSGAAALLFAGLVVGAFSSDWGRSVVVRDAERGSVVHRLPLPHSGGFEIEYLHSYYREPAVEAFGTRAGPGFRLESISSPSEAVLDYYEVEGEKERTGDGRMRLALREPQHFEELPLIGTEKGRKTLVLSGRRVPLFAEGGPPAHLVIRVEEDGPLAEARTLLGV